MRVLSPSDRIQIDTDLGKIYFRPLMKEDEGKYSCKALNDVGEKAETGTIKVFGEFPRSLFLFESLAVV